MANTTGPRRPREAQTTRGGEERSCGSSPQEGRGGVGGGVGWRKCMLVKLSIAPRYAKKSRAARTTSELLSTASTLERASASAKRSCTMAQCNCPRVAQARAYQGRTSANTSVLIRLPEDQGRAESSLLRINSRSYKLLNRRLAGALPHHSRITRLPVLRPEHFGQVDTGRSVAEG